MSDLDLSEISKTVPKNWDTSSMSSEPKPEITTDRDYNQLYMDNLDLKREIKNLEKELGEQKDRYKRLKNYLIEIVIGVIIVIIGAFLISILNIN